MNVITIGYCGVCCDHCAMRTRIPEMAVQLRRFVDAYGYGDWIHNITRDFDFDNLIKGLKWFARSGCAGCLTGGGMPNCGVRVCCKKRRIENCYFCEEFRECQKLNYQKDTYQIEKHYERIKQTGYGNWLGEQKKKAKQSFDNIDYLNKRRSRETAQN